MSELTDDERNELAAAGVAHEKRIADQFAWDRFAASALGGALANPTIRVKPQNDGQTDAQLIAGAAATFADAMMEQRAQRLAGKPGEGK